MTQVRLSIGGRAYDIACREGEQAHFEALGALVDSKAREVATALGGTNEVRQLLLAALLLADDLKTDAPPPEDPALAPRIDAIAARLESLATALENSAPPS
jgi:cell division protein ZapA